MPTAALAFAGGQQRRLVDEVGQVGADEAGGQPGDVPADRRPDRAARSGRGP